MPFSQRLREIKEGFDPPFWVANLSELFERLSYYAVFTVLARYLNESLHFSPSKTSMLTGWFGGIVWFLAIFGGTVADRLGFRRALSLAYLILSVAYFSMGSLGSNWMSPLRAHLSLTVLVAGVLVLPALGMALVKPCVAGTTAHASRENVRSIGYSIYYTLVNVGSTCGPLMASYAHHHFGFESVFRIAAACVLAMAFAVIIFFREPRQAQAGEAAITVPTFRESLHNFVTVVTNPRFMFFLLIFSGYYVAYWQEFILLPLFVPKFISATADTDMMLVAGPLTVISLQLLVSLVTRKLSALPGIALGTLISSLSWLVLVFCPTMPCVIATLIAISIGEVIMSPRYYEYVSRLAPEGQQGTYMGFAFMPIGIGSLIAGWFGGTLIHHFGEGSGNPSLIWISVAGYGTVTAILLWLYGKFIAPKTAKAE